MLFISNNYVSFCSGIADIESLQSFLEKLNKTSKKYGLITQALNGNLVISSKHIEFAARKAFEAFENKTNEANDLGVEIMRLASGQSQINKAFSMGLNEGRNNCFFILIGSDEDKIHKAFIEMSGFISTDEFDTVCDRSNEKEIIEFFEISNEEIEASGIKFLEDLVMERTALVDVKNNFIF